MFCANCGTKLENGAKFCPQCGQAVRPASDISDTAPQKSAPIEKAYVAEMADSVQPTKRGKSKRKLLIALAAGVFLCIAIPLGTYIASSLSPEGRMEAGIEMCSSGDYDEAYPILKEAFEKISEESDENSLKMQLQLMEYMGEAVDHIQGEGAPVFSDDVDVPYLITKAINSGTCYEELRALGIKYEVLSDGILLAYSEDYRYYSDEIDLSPQMNGSIQSLGLWDTPDKNSVYYTGEFLMRIDENGRVWTLLEDTEHYRFDFNLIEADDNAVIYFMDDEIYRLSWNDQGEPGAPEKLASPGEGASYIGAAVVDGYVYFARCSSEEEYDDRGFLNRVSINGGQLPEAITGETDLVWSDTEEKILWEECPISDIFVSGKEDSLILLARGNTIIYTPSTDDTDVLCSDLFIDDAGYIRGQKDSLSWFHFHENEMGTLDLCYLPESCNKCEKLVTGLPGFSEDEEDAYKPSIIQRDDNLVVVGKGKIWSANTCYSLLYVCNIEDGTYRLVQPPADSGYENAIFGGACMIDNYLVFFCRDEERTENGETFGYALDLKDPDSKAVLSDEEWSWISVHNGSLLPD